MKRFFLVQADTDFHSLFCYELRDTGMTKEGHKLLEQPHEVLFSSSRPEHFFGMLNAHCITRTKAEAAPEIKLERAEDQGQAAPALQPEKEPLRRSPMVEEPF